MTTPAEQHPLIETPLPKSVRLDVGEGGLPRLRIVGANATAEIYLQGAQVTSWQPSGEEPVLWVSRESRFSTSTPIRGGVPICFPWFGPHPEAAQHGWARTREWTLTSASDDGGNVRLVFRLRDSAETRASVWPHRFEALYEVVVGTRLQLALTVTNLSESAVTYTEALHAYFTVSDIRETTITGLDGMPYIEPTGASVQDGELHVSGPMTRFLDGTPETIVMTDAVRQVRISPSGARNIAVWNPWDSQAASMADFGDDEWTGMICVEPANIGERFVDLDPGHSHTLRTIFEVGPRS